MLAHFSLHGSWGNFLKYIQILSVLSTPYLKAKEGSALLLLCRSNGEDLHDVTELQALLGLLRAPGSETCLGIEATSLVFPCFEIAACWSTVMMFTCFCFRLCLLSKSL